MTFPLRLLPLFLLFLICAEVVRGDESLDSQVRQAALVKEGQAAPDFSCQATDGRVLTLSAQKGKVVVVYFFSTSVGASVTHLRYLEKEIFRKLADRDDFQLVGIGRGHAREDLVKVGGENKITFPLAADAQAQIFGRYFTQFVPRTVVVARDGSIASLSSGYQGFEGIVNLQQVLERELSKAR